jgi:hypothetical protein
MNFKKAALTATLMALGFWNIEDPIEALVSRQDKDIVWLILRSALIPRSIFTGSPLFVHIPRNAGTSVSHALYGETIGHFTVSFLNRLIDDLDTKPTTFTIIRNPVNRTRSAYNHIRHGGSRDVKLHKRWEADVRKIKSFDDYLSYLEDHFDYLHKLDFVMRPQSFFLPQTELSKIDTVFYLEKLNGSLNAFLSSYGVSFIPHLNSSSKMSDKLSVSQVERIVKIYDADFALIDYLQTRSPASRNIPWPSLPGRDYLGFDESRGQPGK